MFVVRKARSVGKKYTTHSSVGSSLFAIWAQADHCTLACDRLPKLHLPWWKKNPFIFAFHMTEGWRYVPPKRKIEKNEKSRGARTGLVHRVTGMTSVLNLGGLHKVRKIRKTKNKNIEKYKKSLTLFFKRLIFLTCSNIPRTLHPVVVLMPKYELLAYKHIRS